MDVRSKPISHALVLIAALVFLAFVELGKLYERSSEQEEPTPASTPA